MERTSKCRLITKEMSWQERLSEYRKLNGNNDEIMSLSVGERCLIQSAMFSENRQKIIDLLPPTLSEQEFKKQLYFRTYGEYLPDDFFKNETLEKD
jgi:hypothetical protein